MIAQIVLVVTGLWLMVAPSVLDSGDAATTSARIAGPVMAAAAFLAVFAITRGLRWVNLPVGLWLVVAPWVLDSATAAAVNSTVCGLLALALAPVGTPDQSRYGGGWYSLLDTSRLPEPHGRRANDQA